MLETRPGSRGLLLVGTPLPGAATLAVDSLHPWSGALPGARRPPFAVGGSGTHSFRLDESERATGAVVQAVFVSPRGELIEVLRATALPDDVGLPPRSVPATAGPSYTLVAGAKSVGGAISPCPTANAVDLPDGLFRDTNCDGIDGTITRAVFVDWATGSVVATGAFDDPLSSLQAAIDVAWITPGIDHVYVGLGTYNGELVLRDGVSVWGGYDPANFTQIRSTVAGPEGLVGVRAEFLTQRTVLGDVYVSTGPAPAGMHDYGIKAYQADRLRLEPGTSRRARRVSV